MRRLSKEERDAIAQEMRKNPIFIMLQNPCRKFEIEMKTLRFSPEEVFVECIKVLDDLKEDPLDAKTWSKTLWEKLYLELGEISDAPDEEKRLAIGVVIYTLAILGKHSPYTYENVTNEMFVDMMHNIGADVAGFLLDNYRKYLYPELDEKLRCYLKEYMNSDEVWLSDDVQDILDKIPKMQLVSSNAELVASVYRIAKNKITPVCVVLESMIKAGWIENADGTPIANKNIAIKAILKVIGEENANVKQLLDMTKSRNKVANKSSYINGLLKFVKNEEK